MGSIRDAVRKQYGNIAVLGRGAVALVRSRKTLLAFIRLETLRDRRPCSMVRVMNRGPD